MKQPKVIDYSNNKEFLCMKQDAHLLYNLLDQKTRIGVNGDDYLQPGLLSGQSLESVLRETIKSILNHLDNFEKQDVMLL